jgi:hypothetical protein
LNRCQPRLEKFLEGQDKNMSKTRRQPIKTGRVSCANKCILNNISILLFSFFLCSILFINCSTAYVHISPNNFNISKNGNNNIAFIPASPKYFIVNLNYEEILSPYRNNMGHFLNNLRLFSNVSLSELNFNGYSKSIMDTINNCFQKDFILNNRLHLICFQPDPALNKFFEATHDSVYSNSFWGKTHKKAPDDSFLAQIISKSSDSIHYLILPTSICFLPTLLKSTVPNQNRFYLEELTDIIEHKIAFSFDIIDVSSMEVVYSSLTTTEPFQIDYLSSDHNHIFQFVKECISSGIVNLIKNIR